jgi:hypothetical protein
MARASAARIATLVVDTSETDAEIAKLHGEMVELLAKIRSVEAVLGEARAVRPAIDGLRADVIAALSAHETAVEARIAALPPPPQAPAVDLSGIEATIADTAASAQQQFATVSAMVAELRRLVAEAVSRVERPQFRPSTITVTRRDINDRILEVSIS